MVRFMILGAFTAAAMMVAAPLVLAADNVAVKAVMVPQESMKMDFQDGSKRFVLLVRREGKAEGEGKCGEGKCGEAKAETEGKCGGDKSSE